MRYLNQFQTFDFDAFAHGKVFVATGQRPWIDRESGSTVGTIVDTVIFRDETDYRRKDGDTSNNRFEKLSFKVGKTVTVPADAQVRPVNPISTIWGDFRNQLSVRADDIEIVAPRQGRDGS